jgi:hypothetical protein
VTTRWARFARGWIAALFSTLVAAGCHTAAGGGSPSLIALCIALAFAGFSCVALTGKGMSLPRMAASVALSQFAFHGLFAAIGTTPGGAPMAATHSHGHAASAVLEGVANAPTHSPGGWMLLAHGAAAAVTIIALRYGEGAFWRLPAIARLLVLIVVATAAPVAPLGRDRRPRAAFGHLFVPRFSAFVRSSLGLRGPPVGAIA